MNTPFDIDAVIAGQSRLTGDDALWLYHHASLYELGQWATAVSDRIHGSREQDGGATRTYVIDRNINYTNVCTARCTFCAFRRDGDEHDAYTLSKQQLHDKVRQLVEIGGTQILLQGGMHPDLPLAFYEEMLRELKNEFPQVHIHGFSPPEFVEFIAVFDVEGFDTPGPGRSHMLSDEQWRAKLESIMRRLQAAGLDSIPGGGGEIFTPHVRRRIGIGKANAQDWLDVMACGHRLGMFTSATMMFGHIEGVADRIDHMQRVRDRQDIAIRENWPGRYVSFIAWPFQRENTPMGRLPDFDRETGEPFAGDVLADMVLRGEVDGSDKKACDTAVPAAGKVVRMAGASEYLRMQAISRLFMDNVHSMGSSWVTMGPKIGQLALSFGANDMGSVMMEENVVSAAGTTYCLTEPFLCHLIRDAGYIPAQRDNRYNMLKIHKTAGPDLEVQDWTTQRASSLHIEGGSPAIHDPDPVQVTVSR